MGDVDTIFQFRPSTLEPTTVLFSNLDKALTLGAGQRQLLNELNSRDQSRGYSVVRRDNGGGAVWLEPQAQIWIGLFSPSSPGFLGQDYRLELIHLGEAAKDALKGVGLDDLEVVSKPDDSQAGKFVCFAGTSYGEITTCGRKIMGVSLRRTRSWKIYHFMLPVLERQYIAVQELQRSNVPVPDKMSWTALELEVSCFGELDLVAKRCQDALLLAVSQITI